MNHAIRNAALGCVFRIICLMPPSNKAEESPDQFFDDETMKKIHPNMRFPQDISGHHNQKKWLVPPA
ncbi:MAG: hypothetical protein IJX84_08050 [Clostridia bacterium]|nr:hypothetical protein [Clostridia bacterium]